MPMDEIEGLTNFEDGLGGQILQDLPTTATPLEVHVPSMKDGNLEIISRSADSEVSAVDPDNSELFRSEISMEIETPIVRDVYQSTPEPQLISTLPPYESISTGNSGRANSFRRKKKIAKKSKSPKLQTSALQVDNHVMVPVPANHPPRKRSPRSLSPQTPGSTAASSNKKSKASPAGKAHRDVVDKLPTASEEPALKKRNTRSDIFPISAATSSSISSSPPTTGQTPVPKKRGENKRPELKQHWNVYADPGFSVPDMVRKILGCNAQLPAFVLAHDDTGRFALAWGGSRYTATFNRAEKRIHINSVDPVVFPDRTLLLQSTHEGAFENTENVWQISSDAAITREFSSVKVLQIQPAWAGQGLSQGYTNKMVLIVNLVGDRRFCWCISLRSAKGLRAGPKSGLSYTFRIGQDPQTAELLQIEIKSFSVKDDDSSRSSASSGIRNRPTTSFTRKSTEHAQSQQSSRGEKKNDFLGASLPYHPVSASKCTGTCVTVRSTNLITSLEVWLQQNKFIGQINEDADGLGVIHQVGMVPREAAPATISGLRSKQTTSRNLPRTQEDEKKRDDH